MTHLNLSIISISIVLACCTFVDAQDAKPEEKVDPPVEMLSVKVLVTDPDGNPVEEAIVSPRGMRTKAERGSWWGWNDKRDGELPKVPTNAEGIAVIPYPKYTDGEARDRRAQSQHVTHPEFIMFDADRNVKDDPAKVALGRGFRIAATAVDEAGERIKTDIYGITSGRAGKWSLKNNGMLVSPTMKKEDCLLRILQIEEGQPIKFSERIKVEPGAGRRVMLKDHQLSLGVRVEGQLDESVKRPVINGRVAARIARRADKDDPWGRKWSWSDAAEISEDGSFVFESLPPDEVLQLIAVCDDWVPAKPVLGDVLRYFPDEKRQLGINWGGLPHVFQLPARSGDKIDVTLPMVPARSVKVTVNDAEGNPLADADIYTTPNQYWFETGSQMLGATYRTSDYLTKPAAKPKKFEARYFGKSDDNGIAILHDLPPNSGPSLSISCKGYELPIVGRRREINFKFTDEGMTEVVATMQVEGTEVMAGSEAKQVRAQEEGLMNAVKWLNSFF